MITTELNDAVARQVLGWHKVEGWKFWFDAKDQFMVEAKLWNPPKNWAHTGMVLDRMEELGGLFSCQEDEHGTQVSFEMGVGGRVIGGFYTGTPIQEAICRAALEAVEKVKEG